MSYAKTQLVIGTDYNFNYIYFFIFEKTPKVATMSISLLEGSVSPAGITATGKSYESTQSTFSAKVS